MKRMPPKGRDVTDRRLRLVLGILSLSHSQSPKESRSWVTRSSREKPKRQGISCLWQRAGENLSLEGPQPGGTLSPGHLVKQHPGA